MRNPGFILQLAVVFCVVLGVQAEIPRIINYQGKVTDSGGSPVADGNYSMAFSIYDAESGGVSVWNSSTLAVLVSGGVFSVLLGDTGQPTLDLDFDENYWIEVDIAGDIQSPRQRLGSVGYAYMASGLVPGTVIVGEPPTGTGTGLAVVNTSVAGGALGFYAESHSSPGTGISGYATATTGENFGVFGRSDSPQGHGVFGYTPSGFAAVFGENSSTDGYGVRGDNHATSGGAVGVFGSSQSTGGYGVRGENNAGTGEAVGVYGSSHSVNGFGVYGKNHAMSGDAVGVYGTSESSEGYGIYGRAEATQGQTRGIIGVSESPYGIGVYGSASGSAGVWGTNGGSGGYGVVGWHTATTEFNTGVIGISDSSSGYGVKGYGAVGVEGRSTVSGGYGVQGVSLAETGTNYGVSGTTFSESGIGVFGWADHTTGWTVGVHGQSNSTVGSAVYGYAMATSGSAVGVRGKTESNGNGVGVYGIAPATTGSSKGVWGQTASTSGYGVYFTGGLAGTGTKSCVVKTSQGPTLMYCQESPENWFEDFGEGQLAYGRAHIDLDPLFLETVTVNAENPMKAFVQLRDECEGVYVKTGETGFDVVELREGTSDTPFAYRVVAKRKGFETKRLDYCKAAETDSYLYPELREKGLREYEEERARMEDESLRMEEKPRTAFLWDASVESVGASQIRSQPQDFFEPR